MQSYIFVKIIKGLFTTKMKNNIKKLYFSTLLLLTILNLNAQEPIIIGDKLKIESLIMEDSRDIWISLPKDYNKKIKYPVCYFFDGEGHFENLVAQTRRLSEGLYASVPDIILVGIIQKDRTNELTPSKVQTPNQWKRAGFSTSGGYDRFFKFLQTELKPYINNNYSTNNYEILIGHSFGGLAVMQTWLHYPDSFNAYISIDPSMWWDNEKLLNQIKQTKNFSIQNTKVLFLAKASDVGSGPEHHDAIKSTNNTIDSIFNLSKDRYKYNFYSEEDHGTVVVPAEYDGLRFIYNGFQIPVKTILKDPSLFMVHYKSISEKMGYEINPSIKTINRFIEVAKRQGDGDILKQFLDIKRTSEN